MSKITGGCQPRKLVAQDFAHLRNPTGIHTAAYLLRMTDEMLPLNQRQLAAEMVMRSYENTGTGSTSSQSTLRGVDKDGKCGTSDYLCSY